MSLDRTVVPIRLRGCVHPEFGGSASALKDLAAPEEQGVLTDHEFAAQKAKILGG
jgi:hypothetical protein